MNKPIKKFIVVGDPPKITKNTMVKEITDMTEQYKENESSSSDEICKIFDDIIIIENKVIEIINIAKKTDCSCLRSLKACFNNNNVE